VLGANDDQAYSLRVIHRVAGHSGERVETDVPGIIYLEIDGLSEPVLQGAMRDGNAPQMARRLAEDPHDLVEWQTELSSQTGASFGRAGSGAASIPCCGRACASSCAT